MTTEVCPVCNGEGRVYRMTAGYEAVVAAASGGSFGWTGPTHEYRTCRICGGSGLMPQSVCTRPHLDDRDALARAMRTIPVPATYEEWLAAVDRSYEADADAIIAALKEPGGHAQLATGPDTMRDGWNKP